MRDHGHWLGVTAALLCAAVLSACTGCSGNSLSASLDAGIKNLFKPKRTPQQFMIVAVSDSDPDMRRNAVAEVANSKLYDTDWAIKGFIAIALLESDPQARCVAMRALGRTRDPRAVTTALKILNHRDQPAEEVRPPDDLCRWDTTVVLANLCAAGLIPEPQRDATRDTLLAALKNDTSRHVRIAAGRGLGYIAEATVLRALIDALRDTDFAVVHECESALVRLTGTTHDCDFVAWNAWFEANQDGLFARAGEIPESRRPPYSNRFEKLGYEVKEFVRWIVPARKD